MKKFFITLTISSLYISGCAHINSRSFAYEKVSASQLYVWNSQYSAGIGSQGKFCVEGAKVAKARNAKSDLEATAYGKADLNYTEDVVILDPGNAQTTFSSGAYFALCQLAANREDLTPSQIVSMFNGISQAASTIGNPIINDSKIEKK